MHAHPFADALRRRRDVADDSHRLIGQRVDPKPDTSDEQRHSDGSAQRPWDAKPLQPGNEWCKPIADQNSENDRDEDRLRVLEDENDPQRRHHGEREVADDNDGLRFGRDLLDVAVVLGFRYHERAR